jgi:hypothetical protein
MNLGLGAILLIIAVVLFLLSALSDSSTDYISWGLAAFAGSFLAGAMGWGDRSLGSRRT